MLHFVPGNWLKFSLFNLVIVTLLGVVMRYKIGFSFPYFDQKYLQHGHSHFAFSGWITHTIFVLMVCFIQLYQPSAALRKYRVLLAANLVCAYGMLISFSIQGYTAVSISFSTASIFIGYFFSFYFFKDLKQVEKQHPAKNWFKAALIFNVLSSLGTFALAYMMMTKNLPQNAYLASVYYYLHFQYNGFFFFACMGLLYSQLHQYLPNSSANNTIFWLFATACVPAYFLSTLWLNLPVWLYVLVVLAAAAQVFAWVRFLQIIRQNLSLLKSKIQPVWQYLLLAVGFALSVKLILQLGSTIPEISKLAFGFRPIVIAYLHLVLLAIISVFLLVYLFSFNIITTQKYSIKALVLFVFGVFLNEFILMVQGVASFSYILIPYANEALFGAALILFLSILALFLFHLKKNGAT
ncbi:MAG: hypothetical protein ACKV1O_02520 [Saprospiraceae bacterium]